MPSDAPFELRPSPGKGWGAFAKIQIQRGATILREKPHELITEEDVGTAFELLSASAKQQFLQLRDNGSVAFTYMTDAFAENSFAIEIIKPQANISPAHGLFILHSRFNHSCKPNSKIPTTMDGIITSFATRDIMPGEEIIFCYNPDFAGRKRYERHQALRFVCNCETCLTANPSQQLSDMRRTLIRGLQYLTLGVDIDGQRQGSTSSIIIDTKLKKAAENFRIPLSNRVIYNLLLMYLLEEEGLLDDFMIKRLYPGILKIATTFQTESNASIVRLAMIQKTWLEKFCGFQTLRASRRC